MKPILSIWLFNEGIQEHFLILYIFNNNQKKLKFRDSTEILI